MGDVEEKVESRESREEVPFRRRDGEDEEERKAAVEEEKKRRKEMLEKRKEEMKRKNERRREEEEEEPPRRKEVEKKKKVDRDDDEDDIDTAKKSNSKDKIKKKSIREDLVQNAVYFLNSPTVRNTPLAKKVAFMEKKGLTSAEIKEALRRATQSQQGEDDDEEEPEQVVPQRKVTRAPVPRLPPGSHHHNLPPPPPPPPQGPSWRGIATTAALAVCVGGGVTYLAKNYVLPHIWPAKQQNPQDDPVNQTIKELKDQLAQITQSNTDMRDAITAITNATTQQQQIQQLVQQQVQQQLQQNQTQNQHQRPTNATNATNQNWDHSYDVLQPPPIPDEKDKENAELKAQVAALKATLIARQSAASVPPYPSSSHALNWSPADHASTIPSWQQKGNSANGNNHASPTASAATPSLTQPQIQPLNLHHPAPQTPPQQNRTLSQPQTPPRPQTPQQTTTSNNTTTTTTTTTQQQQQPTDNPPYSSSYSDILQLVQDKNLSKEELHRRLNIRDINDKPVGNVPITKGDRQAARKPWERNTTTTTTTTSTSHHENQEEESEGRREEREGKREEKEGKGSEKEEGKEKEGDHAQEAVDHSSEVEVHEPPTHV